MHNIHITINKSINKALKAWRLNTLLNNPISKKRPHTSLTTLTIKLLKLSSLPILLCLSTPSIAELKIEQSNQPMIAGDSSDQCGYYHRQVMKHPMITASTAVTHDPEKIAEIKEVEQAAEKYIMNADLTTFPTTAELHDYHAEGGDELVKEVLMRSNGATQDDVSDVLIYLFNTYYMGEYVPKDDYQAVKYLSKYIDLHQRTSPEQVEALIIGTIYKMGDYAEVIDHEDNPTVESDNTDAAFKILIEAGLIDAEAMQLVDDFRINDPKCIEYSLPRIIVLANEGSRLAIHKLADDANQLIIKAPHLFDETDKRYWQQKAESLPVEGINWRP